jgi:hypothetical protein
MKHRHTIFYARVGPMRFPQKIGQDMWYAKLVFLHLVGSAGHSVHFGAPRAQNVDALFFMLGWDQYEFDKQRAKTCYAKGVILHSVGSVGYVALFGASGV